MKLDEMSEQQIEDAEARGDQLVICEMKARLRRLIDRIMIAGQPKQIIRWGVPNSAANQLVCKRAAKLLPHVEIGIRVSP